MGYDQQAGGSWSGDLLVVDWDEMDESESASGITIKRVGAKGIVVLQKGSMGACRQPATRTSERRNARSRKEMSNMG